MTTKNFNELQTEVVAHVVTDRVAQGSYRTCFIGCLAKGRNDTRFIENKYGIPLMVTRIAESIFEALNADEAVDFFAATPRAIGSDGKDLTCVGWKFLAEELRALPPVPDDIQTCIGLVIEGMDLLADGKEWPDADVTWSAVTAAREAGAWSAAAIRDTLAANAYAARAADTATWSAPAAAVTAVYAIRAATRAARSVTDARNVTCLRQRDTLLRLIKEAPITQEENNAY